MESSAISWLFDSGADLEPWIHSFGGSCDLGRAMIRVGWEGQCRVSVVTESKGRFLTSMVDDPSIRTDRPLNIWLILHGNHIQRLSVSAFALLLQLCSYPSLAFRSHKHGRPLMSSLSVGLDDCPQNMSNDTEPPPRSCIRQECAEVSTSR